MSEGIDLISSIIYRGSTVTFRLLDPDLFVGQDEYDAYRFVRGHYRRHSELPTFETVEEELGLSLPDATEHVDFYLDRVFNRRMYNSVRNPFNSMRDALVNRDNNQIRDLAGQIYSACREHNRERDLRSLSEMAAEAERYYQDNLLAEGMSGIPTGWPTLDRETAGYQNGDLIVWVARPSMGKTTLLLHQAKAAWLAGKSILFVSMEMSLLQITNRFIGHYARVNPEYIRKGQLDFWSKRKFDNAVSVLDDDRRFHLFAGNMGKKTDDVDILIQELDPDIIYIDGLYLMRPSSSSKARNRFDSIAYVLDDVKGMTINRDRPVVATTQFGKGAGSKGVEGSLETIGYTDTISTHSSIVCAIKPPSKKNIKLFGTSRFKGVEVLKGREGEEEPFSVRYSFAPVDFEEIEKREEPEIADRPAQEEDGGSEHIARNDRRSRNRWRNGNYG